MLRFIALLSPTTLVFLGGLVGAIPFSTGGYFIGKWVGWSAGNAAGKASIVEVVNKRNAEAAKVAKEAQTDLDACFNAGGEWDQGAGRCDR